MEIFITILLVLLNGFFVAAEFSIVKVRASQIEIKVVSGNRSAILSKRILSYLDGYRAATQLGITLASLGLAWIGEPVVSKIIVHLMQVPGITISGELAHDIALPIAFAIIMPCYESTLDNVIGIVYLKDLSLKTRKGLPVSIREIMRPVLAVPESDKLGSLLKEFQQKHQQLAIIIREDGGTVGIVMMEDIPEELVGEYRMNFTLKPRCGEKVGNQLHRICLRFAS